MINPGKPFSLHDYKETFLRRVWFFIIPFVIILAGTGLYVYIVPKEYKATTLIQVTPQKVPTDYVRPTVTSGIEERVQSIGLEIMSRTRLEQIIKELNLYPEEVKSSNMEGLVAMMQKNIEVQIKGRGGGYFNISYIGTDPQIVTQVTNKLASLFIEENLNLREQRVQGTSEFLSLELKATKAKLEEQEKIITDFKRRFFGELPEQRDANLRVLDGLQAQLAEIQALIADQPLLKLAQLKNNLEDLQMKYTEKHPDVLILKKRIAEMEKEVEQAKLRREKEKKREGQQVLTFPAKMTRPKEKSGVKGSRLDPWLKEDDRILTNNKEMERLKKEEAKIKGQISRYQDRVEESFNREQEMAILTRDYQNTKEAYSSLLKKSQEAQQAENLERMQKGEQYKIIDPARVPEKPYRPDVPKVLLIGLFLAFACGGAAAFFREQTDRSFRDAEDLQVTFGFKVLANIPRIQKQKLSGAWAFGQRSLFRILSSIVDQSLNSVYTQKHRLSGAWAFGEEFLFTKIPCFVKRVVNRAPASGGRCMWDRALLIGYQASSPIIDSEITEEAIKDFSYFQPRKSGIFQPVYSQLKSHYKIIGIAFLLLVGLGFFSLFPRDSSLSIWKAMVNLFPSMERAVGIGGNILPSEGQPAKISGKTPPSEKRPLEKREEMKQPIPTLATQPGTAGRPRVAGKKEAPSEKQASQPAKAKGHVIRVSTLRDLNLAKEFVKTQRRRGLQVYLTEIKIKDRGVWYIVYIGSFADQEQAARYMKEKKIKNIFPDCSIQKMS